MGRFVATLLADPDDDWKDVFSQAGGTYHEPAMVRFRGGTDTACAQGRSATGLLCRPPDHARYVDLDFCDTLQRQLGSPGDFVQAYVIAHEVGHHVQKLLSISVKIDQMRERPST